MRCVRHAMRPPTCVRKRLTGLLAITTVIASNLTPREAGPRPPKTGTRDWFSKPFSARSCSSGPRFAPAAFCSSPECLVAVKRPSQTRPSARHVRQRNPSCRGRDPVRLGIRLLHRDLDGRDGDRSGPAHGGTVMLPSAAARARRHQLRLATMPAVIPGSMRRARSVTHGPNPFGCAPLGGRSNCRSSTRPMLWVNADLMGVGRSAAMPGLPDSATAKRQRTPFRFSNVPPFPRKERPASCSLPIHMGCRPLAQTAPEGWTPIGASCSGDSGVERTQAAPPCACHRSLPVNSDGRPTMKMPCAAKFMPVRHCSPGAAPVPQTSA